MPKNHRFGRGQEPERARLDVFSWECGSGSPLAKDNLRFVGGDALHPGLAEGGGRLHQRFDRTHGSLVSAFDSISLSNRGFLTSHPSHRMIACSNEPALFIFLRVRRLQGCT